MAYGLIIFTALIFIVFVECVDRERLSIPPRPQPNFDVHRFAGGWYFQYRLPACSWKGSRKFTDVLSEYTLKPDGIVLLKNVFRKELCTVVYDVMHPTRIPGVFNLKDSYGDVISGKNVVVATDYKTFAVIWGCTEDGDYGKCDDAYVNVKTRYRYPDIKTLRLVEDLLHRLFRLTLAEMVQHTQEDPCRPLV